MVLNLWGLILKRPLGNTDIYIMIHNSRRLQLWSSSQNNSIIRVPTVWATVSQGRALGRLRSPAVGCDTFSPTFTRSQMIVEGQSATWFNPQILRNWALLTVPEQTAARHRTFTLSENLFLVLLRQKKVLFWTLFYCHLWVLYIHAGRYTKTHTYMYILMELCMCMHRRLYRQTLRAKNRNWQLSR